MATDERGLTRISRNKGNNGGRGGRRLVGLPGFDGLGFCFAEEEEAGHQDGEGDERKHDASSVVEVAV
jgi:hypothetical protein